VESLQVKDSGICNVDAALQEKGGDERKIRRARNSLEERLVGMEEGQGVECEGWREAVGVEDLDDGCPETGVEESVVRNEMVDDATGSETETDGERVGMVGVGGEHGDTERDERRDVHIGRVTKEVMFPRIFVFSHHTLLFPASPFLMPPAQGFPRPQDPRNYPFQQQQQSYNPSFPIPRRDDEADSDAGDHYSMNSSTTRLAGAPAFYDQPSGVFSPSLLLLPLNHVSRRHGL
jgi:hypothetical protein